MPDVRVNSRLLVIIPAYNESASVASVIREVARELPDASCLVIDDGSRDDTAAVARSSGASVLQLPINLGVGGAMRAGYRFALENDFEATIQIDADGQHDPRHAGDLLTELNGADIVIGARFAGVGDYSVRGPRRWAMRFLSATLSRATGAQLTDTTSGFKACGPRAIALFAREMPAEYLGDTIEALVIAAKNGLMVRQVPVVMRERSAGVPSHNPLKSAVYLLRAVFALFFAYARPASGGSVQ